MRYAMIMAGGAGTRLWPMSRKHLPKQLVRFLRDDATGDWKSLLRVAVDRLEGLLPADRVYICTNEAYRAEINATIPQIPNGNILGEPVGRDTLNAVGFAAAVLLKRDPDAIFATLTADQLITPEDEFRSIVEIGFKLVEDDAKRLVTFNITPTYPATGFGYVERGGAIGGYEHRAWLVENFAEKPSRERAQAYVESGAYGWNSGMFVWSARTFMQLLAKYKPESHAGLTKIGEAWGGESERQTIDAVYPELPKISVDYAVMEPASREQQRAADRGEARSAVKVCTVEMPLRWLDVGSWPAYAETLEADDTGNKLSGDAQLHRSRDTVVVNSESGHLVACVGCEDLIVVHTSDATLIMPAEKAQELKALHGELPDELK